MSQHYADTLIVRCKDDNYNNDRPFAEGLDLVLKKAKIMDYFGPETTFGGSLAFADKNFCQYFLDQLAIGKKLGMEKVILLDHYNTCGAFQLKFGPLTAEQEKVKHLEYLALFQQFMQKNAPNFQALAYLHDHDEIEQVF